MIYLVDPSVSRDACTLKCSTYCGIKPCYGVPPGPIEL